MKCIWVKLIFSMTIGNEMILTGFCLSFSLKLFAVRQYRSGGSWGPNFSGIRGSGVEFFFLATSIRNWEGEEEKEEGD